MAKERDVSHYIIDIKRALKNGPLTAREVVDAIWEYHWSMGDKYVRELGALYYTNISKYFDLMKKQNIVINGPKKLRKGCKVAKDKTWKLRKSHLKDA